MSECKDCLICSNSYITLEDELYCAIHNKKVEEDGICDDYN